jgi:hypothetical protein
MAEYSEPVTYLPQYEVQSSGFLEDRATNTEGPLILHFIRSSNGRPAKAEKRSDG